MRPGVGGFCTSSIPFPWPWLCTQSLSSALVQRGVGPGSGGEQGKGFTFWIMQVWGALAGLLCRNHNHLHL